MNHTARYTLIGIVLGLGAPVGAMIVHVGFKFALDDFSTEYRQFLFFYNYMLIGTVIVLGLFGYFLGQSTDKIHRLSVRDGLTGIYNRRYFQERLEEEFHRAIRYRSELNVIMFDLDFFKSINDRFGHEVGDTVLEKVAFLAQTRTRESDIVARYGGEEFIVLLPQISQTNAFTFAESLRQAIEKNEFKTGEEAFKITVSLGVCSLHSNASDLPEPRTDTLIRAADRAMYAAKKAGRNRTVIFSSSAA